MNDYEAHLGSYDHSHRQRMKDMKQMVKDPTAGARARKAEAKADGLISIKLGDVGGGGGGSSSNSAPTAATAGPAGGGSGGFKKGGFKKSGFKSAFAPVGGGGGAPAPEENVLEDNKEGVKSELVRKAVLMDESVESDTDDEGYEVYDPRRPTD